MGQDPASAQRKAQFIREMSRERAFGNARGTSDASSDRADAPGFGTESQQIPTLPQLPSSAHDDQGEWKINTSALRRAFPNFSHSGSSDEDSIEIGRGHKRGVDATLKSLQSEDPSASMSLTFPTTGDRWKVKSTPPLKARKSLAAEQGDLRARTNLRNASQKENVDPMANNPEEYHQHSRKALAGMHASVDSDDSFEQHNTRPQPINVSVRENRWGRKQPLGATNLNTPLKSSGLQQAMHGATVDTIGSAQPGTMQSFMLPDIPNITELVSGVRRDGTPLFSRSAKPKSRFATPLTGKSQNARPSYSGVNEVPIPADEKALYASLQLLQEKVAGLELDKERLEKRAEDYELEVLQLRSRLEDVEDNKQHSDSGVGYDDEETKTKEWEQEKSQFAINMKTLQKRLDRANRKLADSEMTIKTLEQDRDAAHAQLMQAHLGSEELRTESQAVSEEILKAKKHVDKINRQWEKRLQKLTQQETELRGKIARREKAINEMADLARDLWNTRNAMAAVNQAGRGRAQQRQRSLDPHLRQHSRQSLPDNDAESTMDITPITGPRMQSQMYNEQDPDYMSFMNGDEIAKLRQVVQEDRALLAKAGGQVDSMPLQPLVQNALPRKSSLKQVKRQQQNEATRDISVQFDQPTSRGPRSRNNDQLTADITDIQQDTQQTNLSHRSHRSRRSVVNDDLTSAIILPDITLTATGLHHRQTTTIPRPTPVSDRNLPQAEDHTLRPAQDPAVALASVLKALEDEVAQLQIQLASQQSLYNQHDPALSKRKRKAVFDRMQKILAGIEIRSDQIYALYDVLEGQKANNQLMDENVVEITLRNVGIDPQQALGKTAGSHGAGIRGGLASNRNSTAYKSGTMVDVSDSTDEDDDEELPWEGFETTHSLASIKV